MNEKILKTIDTINYALSNHQDTFLDDLDCESYSSGFVVLAQANPIPGDIQGNTTKLYNWMKYAQKIGAKAIVFPELYLIGNPVSDFIYKFPMIIDETKEWLQVLVAKTIDFPMLKIVVGFVEAVDEGSMNYYNSIAVICDGKIEKVIRKSVLKNSAELNESRYFEQAQFDINSRIIEIGDKKACILFNSEVSNNLFSHLVNDDEILKINRKADYVICCDSSISRTGKEFVKDNILKSFSKENRIPIVYVNQVGANDNLSFDGGSRVYNSSGDILLRAKSFEEQFVFIDDKFENEFLFDFSKELCGESVTNVVFSLDYEPDIERVYCSLVQSIRDYFKKNGFKKAVLGLSGGLDSTVSAVILADALGTDNVLGVSMPSKITSEESKCDAKILAENLGINFIEVPIKNLFATFRSEFDLIFGSVDKYWNCRYKESFTNDNIQARSRAMILWGIANEYEACLPIATSDKSELYMGYATINGDMSGGFAPLGDVTKTKLFALARWLNKNRKTKNVIPESIILKRPGAELAINPKTGKPLLAEDALMPYEFLDEIIWRVENLNQSFEDMLIAEFQYEKEIKLKGEYLSKKQKEEWLRKFFRRMSTALFKWTIMPPCPIVDAHSVNSFEYKQPIVSSNINYCRIPFDDKLTFFK